MSHMRGKGREEAKIGCGSGVQRGWVVYREGVERVGQGGLAVAGHDGLKDVNVVSHIMIIHSTYS